MDAKNVVSNLLHGIGVFTANAGGVILGRLGINNIPAFGPAWVQNTVPGLISIILGGGIASRFGGKDKDAVNAFALGLGLVGFVDIARKNFGSMFPAIVSDNLKLSGFGHSYVQNYGGYPPSYFQAHTQGMNGVGNTPYELQGMRGVGNTAYELQGMRGVPLQGMGNTAYELQGMGRMLVGQ